jgi:hypothetical protein
MATNKEIKAFEIKCHKMKLQEINLEELILCCKMKRIIVLKLFL